MEKRAAPGNPSLTGLSLSGLYLGCCLLLALCLAGCLQEADPVVPSLDHVSEVGAFVERREFEDGSISVYRYEGILVNGNMAVPDLEAALRAVADQLADGEVVIAVANYRAWPDSALPDDLAGYDVRVYSCTAVDHDNCDRGHFWNISDGGRGEIVSQGLWIV